MGLLHSGFASFWRQVHAIMRPFSCCDSVTHLVLLVMTFPCNFPCIALHHIPNFFQVRAWAMGSSTTTTPRTPPKPFKPLTVSGYKVKP